jgi:ribosomal protein L40E
MPTMETMATMLRPREMRNVFASGAEEAIFAYEICVRCVVKLIVIVSGCRFCVVGNRCLPADDRVVLIDDDEIWVDADVIRE